ncbi:MAG TPA: arginine--tRNA ligase [Ignisphaera sp.]|nr:arginine--tRNA ligase [Ignisphaera sp.]
MVRPLLEVKKCIAEPISSCTRLPIEKVLEGFDIPREEFGDLSIVLPRIGIDTSQASVVAQKASECMYVDSVSAIGIYINIKLKRDLFSKLVLETIANEKSSYGVVKTDQPKRIVVEYVSANPVHPLHIGAARNAALGQAISNILEASGNYVQRRFYINDVGRQVAVLALGMKLLGEIEPPIGMKPDHWIGIVYAMTNILIEIESKRKNLALASSEEEKKKILRELDTLLSDLARLKEVAPDAFEKLAQEIKNIDPEQEIAKIMKLYESGDKEVKDFVRKVVELCIEGFKQTLHRFGAKFDSWDWESDLVWSSEVKKIVEELKKSPYTSIHKGAYALDFSQILRNKEIRSKLRIPQSLEIPPLILMRSDETTLYTVRDIAYTIKKFREFNADIVINVIAAEQLLPQAQLRLALYTLGYRREAENLIHYSYEMVTISGIKMSSRRGRIITLDEVLDEAKARSLKELEKRGTVNEEIAEKIGTAAVKFALLSVSPSRPVKFVWENVLNFERNSAPYLLYTYARTKGIERKAKEMGIDIDPAKNIAIADFGFANDNIRRWRLVKFLAEFPEVFIKSYQELDPSILAVYALRLADEYNSWYDEDPILRESNEGFRAAKILLTYGVSQVLEIILNLLGIEPLERM